MHVVLPTFLLNTLNLCSITIYEIKEQLPLSLLTPLSLQVHYLQTYHQHNISMS